MKRIEFLRGLGIAGAGALLPLKNLTHLKTEKAPVAPPPPDCTLIPSETAGPYPLDLTANPTYFRQDVREDRAGVQLNLKMRIIGVQNCEPMPNLRVNIWHCDKDGNYSGYQTEVGQTYLRGYQMTDANGEVEFVTIFPGWYNGRICHIHFQVFVSSVYAAVSQLSFPIDTKNAIYAANTTVYTKGADPLSFNQDGIFSDGYALQLATLTPNTTTGGYDSYLEVAIAGSGVTGLRNLEPETGGQFKLGQNYPNPFSAETTIPFKLNNAADVQIDLWTLAGQKVATIVRNDLAAGDHTIEVSMKALGIEAANYIYQLQTSNSYGIYRQCKMMTVSK